MGLSVNSSTVVLGLAYAASLAGVALWLAAYARHVPRAQAVIRALAWAAAALAAAHLLAEALLERRALFVGEADFLAAGAVGLLALAPMSERGRASLVGPLALALAALTHVWTARPAAAPAVPAQQTLLYAAQAGLHALGVGGCMAALLGTLGARDTRQGQRPAEFASIALMGVGFVLTAAWAWLNWGVAWRNDPRLNLMVAGWLCVVAGRFLRREASQWGLAAEWAGVGLMLVGAFAADWIAAAWPGLSFVAW